MAVRSIKVVAVKGDHVEDVKELDSLKDYYNNSKEATKNNEKDDDTLLVDAKAKGTNNGGYSLEVHVVGETPSILDALVTINANIIKDLRGIDEEDYEKLLEAMKGETLERIKVFKKDENE